MFISHIPYLLNNVAEMTQSSLGSRKRGRSDGDDEYRDFTPLSKRINNLHINNGNHSNPAHEEAHRISTSGRGEVNASSEGRSNGAIMEHPAYNPDMTGSDNPFYYEPNKLLYYLNMERVQRSGQSFG